MSIRILETDDEIHGATSLMRALRDHLPTDSFVATIRTLQRDGYMLAGRFDDADALVALIGYRLAHTLFRGPHFFVDDLVTRADVQRAGHGTALLAWLAEQAVAQGIADVWLDSRSTARGFYEQLGFEMKQSIPCRMNAAALATRSRAP